MASGSISDINTFLESGPKVEEKGQYFVDQATGQYYYQAADGNTMTVVSASSVNTGEGSKP